MKSNYPGIDYSRGMSNVNHSTRIHYGIISQNEVIQSWCDQSESDYGLPICPKCEYEFKRSKSPVKCPNCGFKPIDDSQFFRDDPLAHYYKSDGYQLHQSYDDTDIFIIKSPFFTYCQFCSPCAPGAGYTMNSVNPEDGGIKAYCLGHDWFEFQEAGNWIDCSYCNGTGYRKIESITNFNQERFLINGGKMHGDDKCECWSCNHNFKFGMIGKIKEMIQKAPYPVYSVKTGKIIDSIKEN
jgi:hypothetical protein